MEIACFKTGGPFSETEVSRLWSGSSGLHICFLICSQTWNHQGKWTALLLELSNYINKQINKYGCIYQYFLRYLKQLKKAIKVPKVKVSNTDLQHMWILAINLFHEVFVHLECQWAGIKGYQTLVYACGLQFEGSLGATTISTAHKHSQTPLLKTLNFVANKVGFSLMR